MDPLERLQLQTDIAKLQERASKDLDVSFILTEAVSAYKARDWQKAKKKYEDAKAAFTPDQKVVDLLVSSGKAISKAQARRQIKSGAVKIDGVQLRRDDIAVKPDQQVTFQGERLQG